MPAVHGKRWMAGLLGAWLALAAPAGATGRLCASGPPSASAPCRIALLLPLQSAPLGTAAVIVREGFLAAAARDPHGPDIDVLDSGDNANAVRTAYAGAVPGHVLVVGPLGKSLVAALADAPAAIPTLALSIPSDTALPPHIAAIGLSLDEELRQLTQWAALSHPGPALIVHAGAGWQKRLAAQLAAQWPKPATILEMPSASGFLTDAGLATIGARLKADKPVLVFALLDPDPARQLKAALPPDLPMYASSSVVPRRDATLGPTEMEGVRLVDLPWLLRGEDSEWPQPETTLAPDFDRLFALGIDAYRVARSLALEDGQSVNLDGVTGRLHLEFGNGPARFERREAAAVFQSGLARPLAEAD